MNGIDTGILNEVLAGDGRWKAEAGAIRREGGPTWPVCEGVIVLPDGEDPAEARLARQHAAAMEAIHLYEEGGFEAALACGEMGSLAEKQTRGRRRRAQEAHNPFGRVIGKFGGADSGGDGWALEEGAGYGFDMALLCRRHAFVVGIEPQLERAVVAQRHLIDEGLLNFLLFCGTAESLPFRDGLFGLVTANQVIEHMADRGRAFANIARVLRPGGRFVFALPSRYSLLPEPHAHLMFLGWMPRRWQGWYAARMRGDRGYASYTNLVSHRRLAGELRAAFGRLPEITSGALVYTPASARGRMAARMARLLDETPLRGLMIEALGDMVGCARAPLPTED